MLEEKRIIFAKNQILFSEISINVEVRVCLNEIASLFSTAVMQLAQKDEMYLLSQKRKTAQVISILQSTGHTRINLCGTFIKHMIAFALCFWLSRLAALYYRWPCHSMIGWLTDWLSGLLIWNVRQAMKKKTMTETRPYRKRSQRATLETCDINALQ